jgi:hypothetical protein
MVLMVLAGAGPLSAQSPPSNHSLSMEVRPVSSGGTTRTSNNLYARKKDDPGTAYQPRYSYYSSVRIRESHVGLQIEVRNFGRQKTEAVIEWYFIGKPAAGNNLFVFDQGSKTVEVPAAHREIVQVKSKEVTNTTETKRRRYTFWDDPDEGRRYSNIRKSGYKVAGWITRLTVDGKVMQVRGSTPSIETIGRSETELRRLPRYSTTGD